MLSPLLNVARRPLPHGQPSLVFSLPRPSMQGERREIVRYPSAACPYLCGGNCEIFGNSLNSQECQRSDHTQ